LGLPKAPILLRKIGFFITPSIKSKLLSGRNKKAPSACGERGLVTALGFKPKTF
jgi:hypothetical protein